MTSLTSLSHQHRQALMSNPWFAGLPEVARDDILARVRSRALGPGQRLFSRGEASDGVYGVLEGAIRVSGVSREGRVTVLDFYGPGSWIGEVSTLEGSPRIHDADAHGATLVMHLAAAEFEDLLTVHPSLSRALLRLEAQRLRILLSALELYSASSLEARLASRLLMLAGSFGVSTPQGLKLDFQLPQETLAQLTGLTRQRVNQIFKTWELNGVIEQSYGRIVMIDRAKLEEIAQP